MELAAIYGHRAPGDANAIILQARYDLPVGHRFAFPDDYFLDDVFNAERRREEVGEGHDLAVGKHDVLSRGGPAHRGLVQSGDRSHLRPREGT